jgi:hypothetical protein
MSQPAGRVDIMSFVCENGHTRHGGEGRIPLARARESAVYAKAES